MAFCTSSTWSSPGSVQELELATKPTVIMLLAGTIPIMTFIVERWITRRFINPALASQTKAAEPVSPRAR